LLFRTMDNGQQTTVGAVAGGASQGLRLTTKQRVNKTTSGAATDS
jgi:hypothetical protein